MLFKKNADLLRNLTTIQEHEIYGKSHNIVQNMQKITDFVESIQFCD